jgi:outer membrane protein OmpA-like peptidoglycan-associated protein
MQSDRVGFDNNDAKILSLGVSLGDDHNQTLSEQRAEAVLDYLVTRGIDKGRLASKGFGSSVPLDTNETVAGRENNRRVEFVVYFTILNEGTK